jgi:hypothetical protein
MVQKPEGFVARLVQKAIDNIQITIEKIHIRYEDNRSEVKPPRQTFRPGPSIRLAHLFVLCV